MKQEGHDGPGSLAWSKIGHKNDAFSDIRAAD